jgi:hypothetical protein
MTPTRYLLLGALAALFPGAAAPQTAPDSASFVTRLGADTLAVERFVHTPGRVTAEVVLRAPATTRTRYLLELSLDGELVRLQAVRLPPGGGSPLRRETIERLGDSLQIETVTDSGTRRRTVAADPATLPFIDMVHWPFETALRWLRGAGTAAATIPLLTGSRTAGFAFAAVGDDSMTITHPTRGTSRARLDEQGRLLGLDAGATTRKLVVTRGPWMVLDGLAVRWAALDAAGRGVGALSGRAAVRVEVAGATITVDHGTPARRGREIWGALVPYGQVWRTGANRATHFTTDRDLVLGSGSAALAVPAGAYTLFSIPERDGGVLIVSRQTGQAGTAYDAARDLGRVPLTARPLPTPVDSFTIAVTDDGGGGLLRLQWERTELVVAFTVAASPE